jgi:hypothetical protein
MEVMREFWIKIDKNVPKNVRNNLLKLACQLCDVVYVDDQIIE